MKKLLFLLVIFLLFSGCGIDDDECLSDDDCGEGFTCNVDTGECEPEVSETGDNGEEAANDEAGSGNDDESGSDSSEKPDIDEQSIYVECTPGDTKECYEGPSNSKGVGICMAGVATCVVDGTDWSECVGQILPQAEICGDGIDQNCDGVDATPENVVDIDGDGFTYCEGDCCETNWECPEPTRAGPASFEVPGNSVDDNCNGEIDEAESCDSGIAGDSKDPVDLAKSMGICPVTETRGYGLVTAEILFPDETTESQNFDLSTGDGTVSCGGTPPNPDSYAVLSKFGNVITPREGSSFVMLANGFAADPIPDPGTQANGLSSEQMCTRSNAPADWYQANGSQFPDSPGCGGLISTGDPGKEPLNDPVMLKLKLKVPNNASSFSFDIYFFSREFPEYVCQYNDFFVALLDSTFTSTDMNLQNPLDKNLAMDENKNPVGINLAKSGLFRVCCNGGIIQCGYDPMNNYSQYCTLGPGDLDGTGLYGSSKEGGTGWLVTRGNVVEGEEITLRLAIWDALDHILDSEVIVDNFQWHESAQKPGTGDK